MGISQDKRLEWIGEKTCEGLGVSLELFQQLLGECPATEEQLIKYLDGGGSECLQKASTYLTAYIYRDPNHHVLHLRLNTHTRDRRAEEGANSALLLAVEQVTTYVEEMQEVAEG